MSTPQLLRPEPGPTTLKVTRWGGTRLAALRGGAELRGQAVGESWEFSTVPGHESELAGQPLSTILGGPLPFLAKLIDTALPLSVQVHPGDAPGTPGKEEAWVVLAADPGAHVWAGLADGCDPQEFRRAVAASEPLLPLLRAIPVVPGTVVLVPARTVHAIGSGILLAEIQQPVDCTYRFHDHGSDRPIQPDQALAAVDLAQRAQVWQPEDPPTTLTGLHVTLEILGAGTHAREPAGPSLIVPVRGRGDAITAREEQPLDLGELLLARPGPWRLELAPGSLCVIGQVDAVANHLDHPLDHPLDHHRDDALA